MPKQLTIRGVPDEVGRRLKSLSRARRQSVNATVLEILTAAVDVNRRRSRLQRYATWTQQDLSDFQQALADQRGIDEDLWN